MSSLNLPCLSKAPGCLGKTSNRYQLCAPCRLKSCKSCGVKFTPKVQGVSECAKCNQNTQARNRKYS